MLSQLATVGAGIFRWFYAFAFCHLRSFSLTSKSAREKRCAERLVIVPYTYEIIDDEEFDPEDDLRPEYDFAALREVDRARDIEYQRMFVRLEPDVAAVFPDAEAVNAGLRELIAARNVQAEQRRSVK